MASSSRRRRMLPIRVRMDDRELSRGSGRLVQDERTAVAAMRGVRLVSCAVHSLNKCQY